MKIPAMLRRLILSLLTLLLLALAAETAIRLLRVFRPSRISMDPQLGWRVRPNTTRNLPGIRADGTTYPTGYRSFELGFRQWHDPAAPGKKKLLVIGDSYTDAIQVGNHDTYYARLEHLLGTNWHVFAYGCGGYGTMQQLLILTNALPIVKPDAILWQWCFNDPCNNTYEMDSQSFVNWNLFPRPFFEDRRVVLRCPHEIPVLSRHSKLWQYLAPKIVPALVKNKTSPVDDDNPASPHFTRALQTMDAILAESRTSIGAIPVFTFTVGAVSNEPVFAALAAKHGFHPLGGAVDEALAAARTAGKIVDGHASIASHWCPEGHELVATVLFTNLAAFAQFQPQEKTAAETSNDWNVNP